MPEVGERCTGWLLLLNMHDYNGLSSSSQIMNKSLMGKEFTEVNYIIWWKNRPITAKVLACMRSMTNYRPKMGQMSVRALGDTRSKKDADNVSTVKSFFVERMLLQDGIEAQLKSIATGLIAPSKCNVQLLLRIFFRICAVKIQ